MEPVLVLSLLQSMYFIEKVRPRSQFVIALATFRSSKSSSKLALQ